MENYKGLTHSERVIKKAEILNNGVYHEFYSLFTKLRISRSQFWKAFESNDLELAMSLDAESQTIQEKIKNIMHDVDGHTTLNYQIYDHLYNASRNRSIRLYKRVRGIITQGLTNNENILFLTLTFTDKILITTTEDTRRRYVTRWLKENCNQYVANIDFGKKKGREHYHAVITTNQKIDFTSWVGGACNSKKIRITENDLNNEYHDISIRLGKYISKLTNHALKDTTKAHKVIYSRGIKEL